MQRFGGAGGRGRQRAAGCGLVAGLLAGVGALAGTPEPVGLRIADDGNRLVIVQPQRPGTHTAEGPATANENRLEITLDGAETGGFDADWQGNPLLPTGLLPGTVLQSGRGNRIGLVVAGEGNTIAMAQRGQGNAIDATVQGVGNGLAVVQTGHGNAVSARQDGMRNAMVVSQGGRR